MSLLSLRAARWGGMPGKPGGKAADRKLEAPEAEMGGCSPAGWGVRGMGGPWGWCGKC